MIYLSQKINKMEIRVNNFRSLSNGHYTFQNGFTLLKGESGCGKSTLLEAIRWCLYGQIRQVLPFSGKKDTWVEIKIKDIIIIRKKNPESLLFQQSGLELKGQVAQEQINLHFGSKQLWQNSSYINQNERILLLTGSANDKISLIKELVFTDKQDYSDKLIALFKEKLTSEEKKSDQYQYLIENIKEKNKYFIKEHESALDKVDKNFYNSKLYKNKTFLLNKHSELQEKIKQAEEQVIINQNIKEKEKLLAQESEIFMQYPTALNQQNYHHWTQFKQLREKHDNIKADTTVHIEENLEDLIKLYGCYENNKLILEKYNLTANSLSDEIAKCDQMITNYYKYENFCQVWNNYQKYEKSYQECQQEVDRLENLQAIIDKNWKIFLNKLQITHQVYSDAILELAEEKLKEILIGELKCPQCEQALLLKDNKLIACDNKLSKDYINKLEQIGNNVKQYYINKDKALAKLELIKENEVAKPEKVECPEINDIKLIKQKQIELHQYKEVNIEGVLDKIKILKMRKVKEELAAEIEAIYQPFFEEYEITGEDYFVKFIECKKNIKDLKKYLSEHTYQEVDISDKNKNLLVRVEEKINIIKEQEELNKLYDRIKEFEKEIADEQAKFQKSANEIKYCHRIIKLIQKSENESFEHFLSYFNSLVNDILETLFDNCHLEMKAFKENKQQVKAHIDFHIYLDGHKYENWHILSGGEKDRISIAIVLALNYIKHSNLLLLDECMASLDTINKEKCRKAIKKYAHDKIVINICHEDTEGFYDEVINY